MSAAEQAESVLHGATTLAAMARDLAPLLPVEWCAAFDAMAAQIAAAEHATAAVLHDQPALMEV